MKLITQWGEFKDSLRDTLRLIRLLSQSANNDDPEIVQLVMNALDPYEAEHSFSSQMVTKIFEETERIHRIAQAPPDSQARQAIRNILHGKIEQFSSVSNAVRFLISTIPELIRDLSALPELQHFGLRLERTLTEYSESEPLLPFLTLLKNRIAESLSGLPELPPSLSSSQTKSDGISLVNIVVVEDNAYWRNIIVSAVETTKLGLGNKFDINLQLFDNPADALAAIPLTTRSFAIDGSGQDELRTIAIVDICLPENREHAEKIRAALEGRSEELAIPDNTHGLNLIRKLCSYVYNIPVIVFSTIDSIGTRRTIGSWGVPDEDFLAKGVDNENAIVRSLIRKIEKKTKYLIRTFDDQEDNVRFSINGIRIPFPKELAETFLAIYSLSQSSGRNEFSITEICEARGTFASEESKKTIQDQMYRIRSLILETLQANRVYVNVRELIKTNRSPQHGDEYSYQLNAEVMPLEDEDYYETDLQQYEEETCKVLVIENNPQTLGQIIEPLESLGYEVRYATNVEDAVELATDFLPHIISLDLQIPYSQAEAESPDTIADEFAGLEAWQQIRMALRANSIGIVVATVNSDNNYLVARAAQMGIPIRNFISKTDASWINLFLKKVADEKRRVFLGEVTDAAGDISEPIVEILDGSDLAGGVLRLIVNNEPVRMNKSPIAKIIGLLLSNPKTFLDFQEIKRGIGSRGPVTKNDSKNWTKRIRAVIKEKWLESGGDIPSKGLVEQILESSSKGVKLNVHVIDLRGTVSSADDKKHP